MSVRHYYYYQLIYRLGSVSDHPTVPGRVRIVALRLQAPAEVHAQAELVLVVSRCGMNL